MKLPRVTGWMCLLLTLALHPDWRQEVKRLVSGVPDHEGAIRLLGGLYPSAAAADRAQISLLLAFFHRQLRQEVHELYWVKEHFENFGSTSPAFDFLGDAAAIELAEFRTTWLDQYPGVSLGVDSPAFLYAQRPERVVLTIESRHAVRYRLLFRERLAAEGLLSPGRNTLPLEGISFEKSASYGDLLLEVWTPAIAVSKRLTLVVSVTLPPEAEIAEGKVRLIGKAFRPETETRIEVHRRRYFDRRHFFRRALPPLVAAGGFAALDLALLQPRLQGGDYSSDATPLVYAAHGVVPLVGAGLGLKGVIGLLRSFKTREEKVEINEPVPAAVEYNRFLESSRRQAEQGVGVRLRLEENGFK